jgi:hypothetical protein
MGYIEFSRETENTKVILFEIDIASTVPLWICHEPGTWKYKMTNYQADVSCSFERGAFCYGSFENGGVFDTGINATLNTIGSIVVDNTTYTAQSALTDLRTNAESYYYDYGTSVLYVKFTDSKPPDFFSSIKVGITTGAASQDIYLNDIFYEGRITAVPQIDLQADDNFYGILKYSSGSVKLINNDGYYDSFADENLYGQPVRIKIGGYMRDGTKLAYADYKTLITGYFSGSSTDWDSFEIRIGDIREKLGKTLPDRFLSDTDFAYLTDDSTGKPMNLVWGACDDVPCICLNEKQSAPANYKFLVADIETHSIKSLRAVRVNGNAIALPTLVNDLTDDIAYFNISLASGLYAVGDVVTADVNGFDDSVGRDGTGDMITDALDIVEDILSTYLGWTYTSTYYDTSAWTTAKATDYAQSICLFESKAIDEILERIASGHMANFIITNAGLLTFKKISDVYISGTFYKDQFLRPPRREDDGDKYISSTTIKYNPKWNEDLFKEYTDASSEASIFAKYGIYRNESIDTYLTNLADAQLLSADIIGEYGIIRPVFTVTVDLWASNFNVNDIAVLEMERMTKAWMGLIRCRIIGITYNLSFPVSITLTCKFISVYDPDSTGTGIWNADTVTFPPLHGSDSAATWDDTWAYNKKLYAKQAFGYWCTDSGYAEDADSESIDAGMWQ